MKKSYLPKRKALNRLWIPLNVLLFCSIVISEFDDISENWWGFLFWILKYLLVIISNFPIIIIAGIILLFVDEWIYSSCFSPEDETEDISWNSDRSNLIIEFSVVLLIVSFYLFFIVFFLFLGSYEDYSTLIKSVIT